MRKKESRPGLPSRNRPEPKPLAHKSTAPRPRRRNGFPDRSFRDLQRLGTAAFETYLSFGQIGRTA